MELTLIQEFPLSLKNDWNSLVNAGIARVPFLRFDYLRTWWSTRGGGEWAEDSQLAIITAHEKDQLIGIAPCFITLHENKRQLMLLGSYEISDYLDLIVHPQSLNAFVEALIPYIQQTLASRFGIQEIRFYNLLDESPTLPALQHICQVSALEYKTGVLQQSPQILLSGDYEEYLASLDKKQRHEMRRKMRRMMELPQMSNWYIANDPETIESETQEFLRLMAYEEDKKAFLTPAMREQMRLCILEAFENQSLLLAFLTIGSEKAAAYLNFDYDNQIWVYNSGLNPRFAEHSPGWVLLNHLLKWSIENGRFAFDFMRGNEDYKYKFGAVDRSVMRATITL